MTAFTQRRPVVSLLLLIVFNLFLLSIQVRDEQGRLLIRALGVTLFSPPVAAVNFVYQSVRNGLARYLWLLAVEKKNRSLEQENTELKVELLQLRALKGMVDRTRKFERLKDQYSFNALPASIIWRDSPLYSQGILLNVGTRDGVKKDAAVIAAEGIVGRIVAVTPFNAEVELVTDQAAAAGALLFHSRLQGIVQGTGTRQLVLNFIPSSEAVFDGESVYTSGADLIYPKGLPIGTVVSAEKTGIYQRILVDPKVDFARLEEVMVVLGND